MDIDTDMVDHTHTHTYRKQRGSFSEEGVGTRELYRPLHLPPDHCAAHLHAAALEHAHG